MAKGSRSKTLIAQDRLRKRVSLATEFSKGTGRSGKMGSQWRISVLCDKDNCSSSVDQSNLKVPSSKAQWRKDMLGAGGTGRFKGCRRSLNRGSDAHLVVCKGYKSGGTEGNKVRTVNKTNESKDKKSEAEGRKLSEYSKNNQEIECARGKKNYRAIECEDSKDGKVVVNCVAVMKENRGKRKCKEELIVANVQKSLNIDVPELQGVGRVVGETIRGTVNVNGYKMKENNDCSNEVTKGSKEIVSCGGITNCMFQWEEGIWANRGKRMISKGVSGGEYDVSVVLCARALYRLLAEGWARRAIPMEHCYDPGVWDVVWGVNDNSCKLHQAMPWFDISDSCRIFSRYYDDCLSLPQQHAQHHNLILLPKCCIFIVSKESPSLFMHIILSKHTCPIHCLTLQQLMIL